MKTWMSPKMEMMKFEANEYVAACGDTEYGKYLFDCDAKAGNLWYYDEDGVPTKLGSYTPCPYTHKTAASSDFVDGFVDYNKNGQEDPGEKVIVCLEYHWLSDEYITNWHATTNLDQESWETTKS